MATFKGNDDDNTLNGADTNDSLSGLDGNDALYGNDGNDTLSGGAGNDFLQGGNGADTYLLSQADGLDEINNYDTDGKADTIKFSDLTSSGVSAVFQAFNTNNLVFQYGNGSQLTVDGYFTSDKNYWVDKFQFTDAAWTQANIAQRHNGTSYSETLYAFDNLANTINGLDGNDTLNGGNNADNLNGGTGNDRLYGSDGKDSLTGGTGNDFLQGDNGADTYLLGSTDGIDEINNYDTDNSVDNVNFTNLAAIDVTGVYQAYNTNNLVLQYGNGSQVTLDNYFDSNKDYRVDKFQFTDVAWMQADIAQRHNGTANSENLYAFDDMSNTINGLEGDDRLNGGNNADNLIGGMGNDYLQGNNGADTYTISFADGLDEIYNYDTDGSVDTVNFSDFASTDVAAVFQAFNSSNLILQYGNGSQVTVDYYFDSNKDYRLDKFQFTDVTWTQADIAQRHNGNVYGESLYAFDDMVNKINGLGGDDALNGGNSADDLNGGAGNDRLYGNDGNDILTGGVGNDFLQGGNGADIYVLGLADGRDEIYNYDNDSKVDAIKFTFASTDVTAVFQAFNTNDMVLQYGNGSQVTVDGYFSGDINWRLDKFQFTDVTWTQSDIALRHNGTSNSENLYAFAGTANTMNGLEGDDGLNGSDKADNLNGGAGNDALYGRDGKDTLTGGTGNDYLEGGNGSDTYVLSLADGWDEIYNYDTDNSVDSVIFTNVATTDVTGMYQAYNTDNLILQYSGGQLTIDRYFSGDDNYRVNQFQFTDTTWNAASIAQRHNGTSYSENLYAFNSMANTINGLGGKDNLYGGSGADSLNGGAGYDYLSGGDGADTLDGGTGNDYMVGGNGADLFVFDTALKANVDQIGDFVSDDTLVLENVIFTKFTAPGAVAAGSFVSGVNAIAADANDFLLYNTTTGALSYDADGNGAGVAVQFATLIGLPALSAADFQIV